jgi:glycosyltransferase involved in cell wall biosynthesis
MISQTELKVIVIGPHPPPFNGRALISAAMERELVACGIKVRHLSEGWLAHKNRWAARLGRAIMLPGNVVNLLLHRVSCRRQVAYFPLSGGYGMWLELIYILVARILKANIVLHHHSFSYVRKRSVVACCTFKLCGRAATHIVLGEVMALGLIARYGPMNVIKISNASFLVRPPIRMTRVRTLTLGFLGNITEEKGIKLFLDVCGALRARQIPFYAIVAGPVAAGKLREWLRTACQSLEKDSFFEGIDFLLFPSMYVNEAEPLVVLEALGRGVPCIATNVGELPSIIPPGSKRLIFPALQYVEETVGFLAEVNLTSSLYLSEVARSHERFDSLYEEGRSNLRRWLETIALEDPATPAAYL